MAFATISLIPSKIELLFWLLIFIICAFLIAKNCSEKYFFNGFLVSLVNCVWITSAHIIFFSTYIFHHSQEAAMILKMPMPDYPRLMMLFTGSLIGILSGLILGLFSFIAFKILTKE